MKKKLFVALIIGHSVSVSPLFAMIGDDEPGNGASKPPVPKSRMYKELKQHPTRIPVRVDLRTLEPGVAHSAGHSIQAFMSCVKPLASEICLYLRTAKKIPGLSEELIQGFLGLPALIEADFNQAAINARFVGENDITLEPATLDKRAATSFDSGITNMKVFLHHGRVFNIALLAHKLVDEKKFDDLYQEWNVIYGRFSRQSSALRDRLLTDQKERYRSWNRALQRKLKLQAEREREGRQVSSLETASDLYGIGKASSDLKEHMDFQGLLDRALQNQNATVLLQMAIDASSAVDARKALSAFDSLSEDKKQAAWDEVNNT